MAYVAVVKALYDYAPQDPETELAFKEDQVIYIIEKEDDDWWKGKPKEADDDAVGLVPATYVEELPPLNNTKALYAYESTSPEELSIDEDASLEVFSIEDEWLLVRAPGASHLGFVPRNYCEVLDAAETVEVPDAAEAEAELEARQAADEARAKEDRLRQMRLKDKVETWAISELDGKKKKKGTLGVGNGAVFFASDTDKMTPVKQYSITDLVSVAQPSGKDLQLTFSTLPAPLNFHCDKSDEARAILAKLESSKEAAGEALETVEAEAAYGAASSEDEYAAPAAVAEPKAVRFAAPTQAAAPPQASRGAKESATVLYDFEAQGDDELSVTENESVTIVDKENDEWWLVRNSRGKEGVVPAQYVQLEDGSGGGAAGAAAAAESDDGYDEEAEAERRREEEAAAAALEAERSRQREAKAAQRRAIEQAAREKQRQEEEDRQLALDLEAREIEKQRRREAKRREEQQMERDRQIEQRREAARSGGPPKIAKRPSAQDVTAAAARLPSRGARTPQEPPSNKTKPNQGRVRTWSDKSGQFKVDAEYLGMNGNKIRLHKVNGVIIEVPMDKMSSEDVQMIKRHEARRAQRAQQIEEDDLPLGQTARRQGSSRSEESRMREEPIPAAAMEMPKPRKPRFDWFAFFLDAGCDMDDCTRYAANFERDRIEPDILPDLERSTMRSLGLKEGDVIRVKKAIDVRFAKKTPEQEAQIRADEEYAKQLQEYEQSGGKGPIPQPPPSLFTSRDGKLANNTRRGRPEKKSSGTDIVDSSAIAAASDQLSRLSTGESQSSSPPVEVTPPAEKPQAAPAAPLIAGFDDDAWTIKPSASKPASPAPPPAPAAPAPPPAPAAQSPPANTTDSLLAQIQALRPAATGAQQQQNNNNSQSFDRLSQMVGQQQQPQQQQQMMPMQTGSSSAAYGLGAQGIGQSMGNMMQNPNGPRGPLAPVPSNEGLLNPLQPTQTGMFIPTRQNQQQQQPYQQQQMMPQQTGYMAMQPTGYAQGFQQGYGGQPQQLQPNMTGFGGQSSFNAVANMQQQQQQQQQPQGDKFAPANIFAAMKKNDFGKPEDQRPQESGKYDALRPLTTGYNGGPGMMPQATGMMPQATGMMGGGMGHMGGMGMGMMGPQQTGMMPQQTGYGGAGMGGMMPQMTGYNPYAQQPGYGQFR